MPRRSFLYGMSLYSWGLHWLVWCCPKRWTALPSPCLCLLAQCYCLMSGLLECLLWHSWFRALLDLLVLPGCLSLFAAFQRCHSIAQCHQNITDKQYHITVVGYEVCQMALMWSRMLFFIIWTCSILHAPLHCNRCFSLAMYPHPPAWY